MKSLQFYGNRNLKFVDVPKPSPAAGEVLIKVTDAGLSQAAVAEYIEGPFIASEEPHPATDKGMPIVPCQEFGGIIESVGEGVDRAQIGNQVAVLPAIVCGSCANCVAGKDNLCESLAYRGLLGADGGFCEYVTVPVGSTFPVKKATWLNLVEPLLVATHAASLIPKEKRSGKVMVLGAGCVGLCVAAVLKDIHGFDVVMSDPLDNRLSMAQSLGFVTAAYDSLEKAHGAYPLVVDAAGKELKHQQQPLDLAIDLCAPGGSIVGVGTYFITVDLLPAKFLFSEKSILPSFAYTSADVSELRDTIDSISVDFDKIYTRIPFDRLIEEGYFQAEMDRNVFTRIVTSISDA